MPDLPILPSVGWDGTCWYGRVAMSDFLSKRKQDEPPAEEVRSHQVKVMLNDHEIHLLDLARGSLSRAEVFRFLLLNKMPRPIPELNAAAWIALSRSAANLNQLARQLNMGEQVQVEQLRVSLEQFRMALIGATP